MDNSIRHRINLSFFLALRVRSRTLASLACYNQLQKYLRHCTVFWHKWPVHGLVLVIPPPPLIKVASNTRPCSKLGGTTFNGREEGGQYYISQTCDQQRFEARKVVFSWECLNIFVTGCSRCLRKERRTKRKIKQRLCTGRQITSKRLQSRLGSWVIKSISVLSQWVES